MNQKTRYKLATIIFAALLLHELYRIGRLLFLWLTREPLIAWTMSGYYRWSPLWIAAVPLCAILTLIPLIILTKNAFEEKTDQKSKARYMACYSIGMLILWVEAFKPGAFSYLDKPSIPGFTLSQFRQFIFVALFSFALFRLMQSEAESKVGVAIEVANDKVRYYKELLDKGIISAEEFENMKAKINKGEL